MNPPVREEVENDQDEEQFNLGAMLGIALAAVVGTTLTVWVFHFMHVGGNAKVAFHRPLPRIAVLPFHSLSAAQNDILDDEILTSALIMGLSRVAHIETLPTQTDADPVMVGHDLGVQAMMMGKVERLNGRVRVLVQLVSAKDGRQVWSDSFEDNASATANLSARIDKAVAGHLTALLD